MSDDAAKQYEVKIVEPNLYVRMMTLNYDVVSAIEENLPTSLASYPYPENLTKAFLGSRGLHSWKHFPGTNSKIGFVSEHKRSFTR